MKTLTMAIEIARLMDHVRNEYKALAIKGADLTCSSARNEATQSVWCDVFGLGDHGRHAIGLVVPYFGDELVAAWAQNAPAPAAT